MPTRALFVAVAALALVCGTYADLETGASRRLLQNGGGGGGIPSDWQNGQGDISDGNEIAQVGSQGRNGGSAVARSAATAFARGGRQRNPRSNFAQTFARAMATASNRNTNAAAEAMGQAASSGGQVQSSMAVAIAAAFTSGNQSIAFAFAQAITVSINKYGCTVITNMISEALSIASSNGQAQSFARSITTVTRLGQCGWRANDHLPQGNGSG